ncbi:MAG: S8 family serine peptidase [Candidatus Hadarchaeota archaeon]
MRLFDGVVALVLTLIVVSPSVFAAPEIVNHIVDVSPPNYSIIQSTDNFYNFYSNENTSKNFYGKLSENIQLELELDNNQIFRVLIRLEPANLTGVSKENVIGVLKEHANRTQTPILEFLQNENSIVLDKFWLANAILTKVSENTLLKLASFSHVWRIHEDFKLVIEQAPPGVPVPEPEVTIFPPSYMWGLEKIRAPDVWESWGIDGTGVRVAVLDAGVKLGVGQEALASKLWTDDPSDPKYPGGWIEFSDDGNVVTTSIPYDSHEQGHGTHVSATVVGNSVGVASGATLMHALVYHQAGLTSEAYISNMLRGMSWAADPYDVNHNSAGQQANIVVISSGLEGYHVDFEEPIKSLKQSGIVMVASIGNKGLWSTISPGNIYESFAIGAVNEQDEVWSLSSGGIVSNYVKPDFTAPGVDIVSLGRGVLGYYWDAEKNEWVPTGYGWGYVSKSGTSMASPHVAGTVALMLQANPDLTVDDVYGILMSAADDLGTLGQDTRYGWGIIDAFKAVEMAKISEK